jgi:hypothetical protein
LAILSEQSGAAEWTSSRSDRICRAIERTIAFRTLRQIAIWWNEAETRAKDCISGTNYSPRRPNVHRHENRNGLLSILDTITMHILLMLGTWTVCNHDWNTNLIKRGELCCWSFERFNW